MLNDSRLTRSLIPFWLNPLLVLRCLTPTGHKIVQKTFRRRPGRLWVSYVRSHNFLCVQEVYSNVPLFHSRLRNKFENRWSKVSFVQFIAIQVFRSRMTINNTNRARNLRKILFNPLLPNVPFWSPWKHQKTFGFLMFSGGSKGNIGK